MTITDIASNAIAQIERDREQMRAIGSSTPAYEAFVDLLVQIIGYSNDPQAAIDRMLTLMQREYEKGRA